MLLPLGGLAKPAVRAMAEERGLPVFDKPDSQEICFVPDGDYAEFVERHAAQRAGAIVDQRGQTLGSHDGIHRFTVGQRKGLGLATGAPLYVLSIDAESGNVTVGPRDRLERPTFTASGVNWISTAPPASWLTAAAQIRHRHRPAIGRVRAMDENRAEFEFVEPQPAVTPGQAAVFYDGDRVVGGGWID
jgi:tRNA-specific 2-thiouridylase